MTFTIDEGPQYRLGKVGHRIRASRRSMPSSSHPVLHTQTGDIYDAALWTRRSRIWRRRWPAMASLSPISCRSVARSPAGRLIDLVYAIEGGKRLYVERIEIHGNTKTRDEVIRREFDFGEGDAYNRALVDRGERQLKALGYFKTVKIDGRARLGAGPRRARCRARRGQDRKLLRPGGYSATDGAMVQVSVGDTNFLGTGDIAKASVTYGQYARGFDVSLHRSVIRSASISRRHRAVRQAELRQPLSVLQHRRSTAARSRSARR